MPAREPTGGPRQGAAPSSKRAGGSKRRSTSKKRDPNVRTGRLQVHDPFELIRWLALSQPDPRKALAELVQNSLDAGARTIQVTRRREKGVPTLRIRDDGEGVIPEMDRPDALRYIATNIGHSRKRSLTPKQRLDLMTQGQYGIGLLGFWSLGETLEMRTAIPGQIPHRLVLYRDRPDYLIEPLRGRLLLDEHSTEVVVSGLHREAMGVLGARRAAEHLAFELRGQLLARDVDLSIHDRVARGRAPKMMQVRPRRFLGERLEGVGPVEVPGYPPVQIEIYLRGDGEDNGGPASGIAVFAAGTLVAEGFHEVAALGLDRAPWTDPRLTGMVDFPALQVAPGSRRGIIPNEAAGAFARALGGLEPTLEALLEQYEDRTRRALDRTIIRDLQRAFRDFYRRRPSYTMLPVSPPGEDAARDGEDAGAGLAAGEDTAEAGPDDAGGADDSDGEEPVTLLPPGPLAIVEIRPSRIQLECNSSRTVRARGLDGTGRPVADPVTFRWWIAGGAARLESRKEDAERDADGEEDGQTRGARVGIAAGEMPGTATLHVEALAGGETVAAEAPIEVLEDLPSSRTDEGIPEPELVDTPGARWRSRILDGRWQVNTGHPDYRALADRPTVKLRYLALLFSKEVVLRSRQDPRLEPALEEVVEVAAYADRSLARRRRTRSLPPA